MMQIHKKGSIFIRLLCIFALLSLNFSHNSALASSHNHPKLHELLNAEYLSTEQQKVIFASELCSSASDHTVKYSNSQQDKQDCHTGTPCHACRIGGSMLPPPSENQIGATTLVTFYVLKPLKSQSFAQYIVAKNASPRAPPTIGTA